jgi:hypothetical protein
MQMPLGLCNFSPLYNKVDYIFLAKKNIGFSDICPFGGCLKAT